MAIKTAGGLSGFLDYLETLHEILTDERQIGKLFDLSTEFGGWRRSKGDGNCFYRACGFAFVEALLVKAPKNLKRMYSEFERSSKGELNEFLAFMKELAHLEPSVALDKWYHALLIDTAKDAQLVRAMRMVVAAWLSKNEAADFNGMRIGDFVRETSGIALATYLNDEVLADGKEAELLMIHAATAALGYGLEIIQLDRSNGPAQRYTLPDDSISPLATVLFRPGHYDIFYRRELFEDLKQLEEKMNLRKSCAKAETPAPARPMHGTISARGSGRRQKPDGPTDQFDDAMDTLRQKLRDSFRECVVAIDEEVGRAQHEIESLESNRAACGRLRKDIDRLEKELGRQQEALRDAQADVERLRSGGFGTSPFACCYTASTGIV